MRRLRWRRHPSIRALLVMRILLVSNGLLLGAVGTLYVAFGSRPAGYVVGAVLFLAAIGIWALIPLTDPYRQERHL